MSSASAQDTIRVEDDKGYALISVYVSYGNVQKTTDLNGQFTVPSSLADSTLIRFEYLAFRDKLLSWSGIRANNYLVVMDPDNSLLEEVVIVGRTESSERELPNLVRRIEAEQIFSSAAQNSAEALEIAGGVFVQKSQMGGGSPVLRGFEANKVLLVIDGIRMNNAIYRNGHLQNAITIDPSMLSSMDIIFGAGSLLYGSEALGGVIHFQSRSPEFNFNPARKNRQSLNAYVRYNSSNQEKRTHIDYNLGFNKWAVITSLSYVDFSDLRAGSNRSGDYPEFGLRPDYVSTTANGTDLVRINPDPDIQIGTAYSQLDFMQKWAFKHSDCIQSEFNFQYSTSSDIPRYDNLIARRNGNLRFAEWYYGPQNRFLAAHHLKIRSGSSFFDKAILISSYQRIEEDRFSRDFGSSFRETQLEDLDVLGFTADLSKKLNSRHSLMYGLDMQYNDVDSEAFLLQDPYSASPVRVNTLLSRYPSGGSQQLSLGSYVQHSWQTKDSSLTWINGLRFSWQKVNFIYNDTDPFTWPGYFYEGIEAKNQALVGVSGLNYYAGPYSLKLSSGSSFRSPNLDDLAKIRVNNNEITIPNPDLRAERVWNNELSLSYRKPEFNLAATVYYSILNDAIVRENTVLPDGSPFFISRGDSLAVTGNTNAESGSIKGMSLHCEFKPSQNWQFSAQYNIQSGIARDESGTEQALGHIPPSFGMARVNYSANRLQAHFNARYNAWKAIQDFGGSVDNPELATPEGSPAFLILSLGAEYQISPSWLLSAGVNNLLDRHYRPFASGVSGPGRHIYIALAYSWES